MGWYDGKDVWYWDSTSSTTSSTGGTMTNAGNTISSATNITTGFTTGNVAIYYWRPKSRQFLVEMPENWNDEDSEAWVRLINIDTESGFIVTALIKGKIMITDPDVERRTMEDFMPLVRRRVSEEDLEIINSFFAVHPIQPEDPEAGVSAVKE